jgi:archaellum component FlaC
MDPNKIRKYLIFSLCILLLVLGGTIVIEKIISRSFTDVYDVISPLERVDSERIDRHISGTVDSINVVETGIGESRDELRAVGDYIGESRESIAASRDSLETGRDGVGDIREGISRLEAANERLRKLIRRLQSPGK